MVRMDRMMVIVVVKSLQRHGVAIAVSSVGFEIQISKKILKFFLFFIFFQFQGANLVSSPICFRVLRFISK